MDVNVSALGDIRDGFADRTTVFEDGFILGEIAHGHFMAERNIMQQLHRAYGFAFQSDRSGSGAPFHIGDCYADIIVVFVQ